jgi:hypothetical protein
LLSTTVLSKLKPSYIEINLASMNKLTCSRTLQPEIQVAEGFPKKKTKKKGTLLSPE